MNVTRRSFLAAAGAASLATASPTLAAVPDAVTAADRDRMRSIAAFSAATLGTGHPMPFAALIVNTDTGEELLRGLNRVGPDHDPSAHAETLTMRRTCAKLNSGSLKGYTLYTTC